MITHKPLWLILLVIDQLYETGSLPFWHDSTQPGSSEAWLSMLRGRRTRKGKRSSVRLVERVNDLALRWFKEDDLRTSRCGSQNVFPRAARCMMRCPCFFLLKVACLTKPNWIWPLLIKLTLWSVIHSLRLLFKVCVVNNGANCDDDSCAFSLVPELAEVKLDELVLPVVLYDTVDVDDDEERGWVIKRLEHWCINSQAWMGQSVFLIGQGVSTHPGNVNKQQK